MLNRCCIQFLAQFTCCGRKSSSWLRKCKILIMFLDIFAKLSVRTLKNSLPYKYISKERIRVKLHPYNAWHRGSIQGHLRVNSTHVRSGTSCRRRNELHAPIILTQSKGCTYQLEATWYTGYL